MASRSLLLSTLRRREIKCFSGTEKGKSSRFLSTKTEIAEEDSNEEDDLRSRIFRLRLPKRSVTNIIQKLDFQRPRGSNWSKSDTRFSASRWPSFTTVLLGHRNQKLILC